MKTTLRHYGSVALLLAVILLVTTVLSILVGGRREDDRPCVLVTSYPLYVAVQNVLGDTDGLRVEMLSGVGAGCLHDYQLTPSDRLAAQKAQMIITNGAGSDIFLKEIEGAEEKTVDTSEGLELICTHHHHEGEQHHEHTEYNEHLWVSPTKYMAQVGIIRNALMRLDPQRAEIYSTNGAEYVAAIDRMAQRLPDLSGLPCVLFHDSLSYLAAEVGLDVRLTLTADGESGIAAADLAQVERLAKEYPDLVLLYDTQYPIRYSAVDRLVPAQQVIALETAVIGEGRPTDWLDAMGRNVDKLTSLTEGGDTP